MNKKDTEHTISKFINKDEIYLFKVRDYTTELLGRKNIEGDFYYVQRGDGVMYKYDSDRIIYCKKLK